MNLVWNLVWNSCLPMHSSQASCAVNIIKLNHRQSTNEYLLKLNIQKALMYFRRNFATARSSQNIKFSTSYIISVIPDDRQLYHNDGWWTYSSCVDVTHADAGRCNVSNAQHCITTLNVLGEKQFITAGTIISNSRSRNEEWQSKVKSTQQLSNVRVSISI